MEIILKEILEDIEGETSDGVNTIRVILKGNEDSPHKPSWSEWYVNRDTAIDQAIKMALED